MCDQHKAELKRTLAEAEKFAKEKDKLEEEIKKLKEPEQHPLKSFTWWRDLLGIFSVILTLAVGVYSFSSKLGERNKLIITREVVELTDRLDDPQQQGKAAILLSAYGEHAVPVLLNSLRRQASDGLLNALELVGTQEPGAVVPPLRRRAGAQLEAALAGSDRAVRLFKNYVKALGAVGKLDAPGKTKSLFERSRKALDCSHLNDQGKFMIALPERTSMCDAIDLACEQAGLCK